MRRKAFLILTVVVLVLMGLQPVVAITWGEPDTEHTHVGAMLVDWPGYGPYQWCSGTLVHPRVFLTAGHCTVNLEAYGIETVWVNFDQYALNERTLLDVEEVITHPDYNWGPTSDPHDVGILILKKRAKRIKPAVLPEPFLLDTLEEEGMLRDGSEGAKFTLVGYGGTLQWPPPQISYDDYRRFAESEFQTLLKTWLRMSQNQATDDGGTCFGDSGGPAFWTDPDTGEEILVGITSWGDAQCVATGFNYRVDIPQTLDFIDDVIDSLK